MLFEKELPLIENKYHLPKADSNFKNKDITIKINTVNLCPTYNQL